MAAFQRAESLRRALTGGTSKEGRVPAAGRVGPKGVDRWPRCRRSTRRLKGGPKAANKAAEPAAAPARRQTRSLKSQGGRQAGREEPIRRSLRWNRKGQAGSRARRGPARGDCGRYPPRGNPETKPAAPKTAKPDVAADDILAPGAKPAASPRPKRPTTWPVLQRKKPAKAADDDPFAADEAAKGGRQEADEDDPFASDETRQRRPPGSRRQRSFSMDGQTDQNRPPKATDDIASDEARQEGGARQPTTAIRSAWTNPSQRPEEHQEGRGRRSLCRVRRTSQKTSAKGKAKADDDPFASDK